MSAHPIPDSLLGELRRIVGSEHVSTGRTHRELYAYDASLALGAPDAIAFPGDAAQTAALLAATARAGVPCVPRGFGTNLSGGSVAPRGGVVVALTRMNRILDIQPERRTARVQPGVTNLELQDALAPLGTFFAPDPASQKVATLGGNVAENSGGPHCLKHGVTTNHVLGLQVALPGGELVELGGEALDPPGYDLRGLLVGSEGTLGIVTEITVRILPRPEAVATLLAVYDDVADAARSVAEVVAAGIVPATLEMMDAPVMRVVEESFPCGYPLDAAAVLIVEVDGPAAGLRQQAARVQETCQANGCRSIREARDEAERDQLWAGRRGAFGAIARIAPNFLVADCSVPPTRLPEALAAVARTAQSHGFPHGNVFHAGDGNLHPLLFFDSRDHDQMRRVHQAGREIMEACTALGGTVTGEHGVGVEKRDALRLVFAEADLDFQRTLREVFDPVRLLNPGKVLPEPRAAGEDPPRRAAADLGEELRPADESEAAEMVRAAIAAARLLLPVGRGRRARLGETSAAPMPLWSTRLAGVVARDRPNQVVTARAGTRLACLQQALSEGGQWLPLRPPLADGATLGGVVALNACGPERLRYGAPRDLLLGLRFISGEGQAIAAGGRVVKNVAGYDVTRLLAGSAGTLGFLTEATFRVMSRPELCRLLAARGDGGAVARAAAALLVSKLEPTFVAAVRAPDGWELSIGFEGFAATVAAQARGGRAILGEAGLEAEEEADYDCIAGPWGSRYEALYGSPFLLRADLPIDRAMAFAAEADLSHGSRVDLGCGRVLAGLDELSRHRWRWLCDLARTAGGTVVLERAPREFRETHRRDAVRGPEWRLMRRLKAALDPHGLFAPGRLPGEM
ncbi:MAG: FAD-linked oxidase C-terminal domain-containing protein [Candidatus Brocadiia bacterium]